MSESQPLVSLLPQKLLGSPVRLPARMPQRLGRDYGENSCSLSALVHWVTCCRTVQRYKFISSTILNPPNVAKPAPLRRDLHQRLVDPDRIPLGRSPHK